MARRFSRSLGNSRGARRCTESRNFGNRDEAFAASLSSEKRRALQREYDADGVLESHQGSQWRAANPVALDRRGSGISAGAMDCASAFQKRTRRGEMGSHFLFFQMVRN